MYMDSKNVGNFISQLRLEKKLTQRELAEKIGVTSKAISRWECGLGFPDISLLEPLSKELGVSILELLKGKRLSNNKNVKSDDIDYLIKIIINMTNDRRKKLFLILYSLIVILVITLTTIIYAKNNFHGYINYFPELQRKIMLVPFNSIIIIFGDGVEFLYNNILLFFKNFIVNFMIGLLINSYLFMLVKNKNKYIKIGLFINIFIELFKWMVLLGMFDIDDILIRFISAIIVYYVFSKKRKEVKLCLKK